MASCSTPRWVSTAPYVTLTVTESESTATSATLSYTLKYVSDSAASCSGARSYTIKIGSKTITGSYDINGKSGTYTVKTGTVSINKTTSKQTINFSVSFQFNLTWSGTYGGTKTASSSITIAAKTSYTVRYNANGGAGAPSAQTKWHGSSLTLSTVKPSRSGYTFTGWATSSTATSATYSAGGSYTANSSVTLYAVWAAAYTKPKITSFVVSRSGNSCRVRFSWSCSDDVTSITIAYQVIGSASAKTETVSASGKSGSVDKVVGDETLSTDDPYLITVKVKDSQTTTLTRTLPGAVIPISVYKNSAVGFGRKAETPGYLEIGYYPKVDNHKFFYGVKTDGKTLKGNLDLCNHNNNMTIGYGNYDLKDGYTNVYGHDVNIGVSNIATPTLYKPYYSRGDSIPLTIRTAGYIANSGKDLYFVVPLSKPVIGDPTVTATSGNGFILMQNGKYTSGSTGETAVHPSSYTATLYEYGGVLIKASFSSNTNVTNADSIGVLWNGNITFS